jgi:hypothetical protein
VAIVTPSIYLLRQPRFHRHQRLLGHLRPRVPSRQYAGGSESCCYVVQRVSLRAEIVRYDVRIEFVHKGHFGNLVRRISNIFNPMHRIVDPIQILSAQQLLTVHY